MTRLAAVLQWVALGSASEANYAMFPDDRGMNPKEYNAATASESNSTPTTASWQPQGSPTVAAHRMTISAAALAVWMAGNLWLTRMSERRMTP